jgi:Effector-associated domain 11
VFYELKNQKVLLIMYMIYILFLLLAFTISKTFTKMTKEEILRTIRHKIAQADLEGALNFMASIIQEEDELFDDLIVLKASYVYNKNELQSNKIKREDYLISRARIEAAALDIAKKIKPVVPSPTNVPEEYDTPIVKKLTKNEVFKVALSAKLLRKADNYADALTLWQTLPEEKQQKPVFCNEIAMLHRLTNNHDKAVMLLENIRNHHPKDVRCLNELATCQRERNWSNLALETIKTGLSIEPANGYLHSNQFFIHLFFTLDKARAMATRDNYETQFGKPLIENPTYRAVCNDFLAQLDAINMGSAPTELMEKFIEECQGDKRAFQTAKRLQVLLKNR